MNQDEFVFPKYNGESLYNVIPTIQSFFGIKPQEVQLDEKYVGKYRGNVKKVILFVLDGFGYKYAKGFASKIELLKKIDEKGDINCITSGFPSTTAASLTTLATGLTPQEHGLIEWNLYMEEIGEIIQTLPFSYLGRKAKGDGLLDLGVSPSILLDKKTVYEEFVENNVDCFVFVNQLISKTVYSGLSSNGAEKISYRYLSDLLVSLRNKVKENKDSSFYYVYWSGIDSQGHKFAPDSDEYFTESKIFFDSLKSNFIDTLSKEELKDTLILFTADHGQISVDPTKTIYLNKDKFLISNLKSNKSGNRIHPWGGPRDVFLSVKEDNIEKVVEYLNEKYGKSAWILKTEDAIKKGLFGLSDVGSKLSERFLQRAGNVLIIPYGNNTIWFEHLPGELFEFVGHHGGLSENEMQIPFIIVRGEDLYE